MNKYKFVDFSKRTAKRNPDMIIREYQRLLNEVSELLEKEYSTENEVTIHIKDIKNFIYLLNKYYKGHVFETSEYIKVVFNFKELQKIFTELQGKRESVEKLQKEKYELTKEFRKFKEQYVYKEVLGYEYF